MSTSNTSLSQELSVHVAPSGLKLWEVIGIGVGFMLFFALLLLVICVTFRNRRHYRKASVDNDIPISQIPLFSKEIKEVRVVNPASSADSTTLKPSYNDSNKFTNVDFYKTKPEENHSNPGSFHYVEKNRNSNCGEGNSGAVVDGNRPSDASSTVNPSPLTGLPEFSYLGWGHWFTLRDLEIATNWFSKDNIVGEGGYGVVYKGQLINGAPVAVKRLLNNLGQAEREFRVEVEAIGHVRHKNLVRLLGYCVEGTQRMLVYEYVCNGNLEQWLHGSLRQQGSLTWEARIKIILGTAKALAYLHEAIEPKVVHRDIKSSNILIDNDFDAKVSDFGLAKLLGAGKSHITTRVMGTFGYVAPEYANTGLLNEKSDVYSFGVLLLEAITGREPVDYEKPANEVNLVNWLKMMVANRRSEEVVDPDIISRPSTRYLKRALLTALRCVDPDSEKRPRMSQVVQMLESDGPNQHKVRMHSHKRTGSAENGTLKEASDSEMSDNPDSKLNGTRSRSSRN